MSSDKENIAAQNFYFFKLSHKPFTHALAIGDTGNTWYLSELRMVFRHLTLFMNEGLDAEV